MPTHIDVAARIGVLNALLEQVHIRRRQLDETSGGDYHRNKSGKLVHSSGKKANKKFANNTTFKASPQDALLHTDNHPEGIRARLPKSAFTFHGSKDELKTDPRKKWYPVAKERGWASAAASLRKVYEKAPAMRQKVMAKVKQTEFTGAEGKPISAGTIDPTGALHDERPQCMKGSKTKSRHPGLPGEASSRYRLCGKGPHGRGGPNEYETKFRPHKSKHLKLHAPAAPPTANIAAHQAARGPRRHMLKTHVGGMLDAAKATRAKLRPKMAKGK